jgi:hypothetical protein
MVEHSVTGLLSEEKQPEAFANNLAQLLQDPARCDEMGRAGLARAKRLFSKEVTAHHLLRAFAECSGIRFDAKLALKYRLCASYLKRLFLRRCQLKHHAIKARDKTFNLQEFIAG